MENFSFTKKAEWFENAEEIDREYALLDHFEAIINPKEMRFQAAKLFLVLLKLRKSYDL